MTNAPLRRSSTQNRDRKGPFALTLLLTLTLFAAAQPVFETWTTLPWRHDNARSLRRYQPESIGPGVAIFDYNRDGRMDIFFPNSGPADFFQPAKPLRSV